MAKELVFKLKVIDESGNVVEKAINNINDLKKAQAELSAQLEKAPIGSAQWTKLKEQLGQVEDAQQKAQRAQDGLTESLANAPGVIGTVTQSVQGLGQGFRALLANPVVAVVSAIVGGLGLLFNALKKTEAGVFALNRIFATFTGLIQPVVNLVQTLAINLAEGLANALDLVTGLFAAGGSEAAKYSQEASRLADELNRVEEAEGDLAVKRSEVDRQLAEARAKLQDSNLSLEERRKALEEVKASEIGLADQERQTARDRARIMQRQSEMDADNKEKKEASEKATIALNNAETANFNTRTKLAREAKKLESEERALIKARESSIDQLNKSYSAALSAVNQAAIRYNQLINDSKKEAAKNLQDLDAVVKSEEKNRSKERKSMLDNELKELKREYDRRYTEIADNEQKFSSEIQSMMMESLNKEFDNRKETINLNYKILELEENSAIRDYKKSIIDQTKEKNKEINNLSLTENELRIQQINDYYESLRTVEGKNIGKDEEIEALRQKALRENEQKFQQELLEIEQQGAADRETARQERLQRELQYLDALSSNYQSERDYQIRATEIFYDELIRVEIEGSERQIALTEAKNKRLRDINNEFFSSVAMAYMGVLAGVASFLGELAGEDKKKQITAIKLEKAAAIGSIAINSQKNAAKAGYLTPLGIAEIAAGILGIATVVTQGANAIKAINSVEEPPAAEAPRPGPSMLEKGGLLRGPSHAQGGILTPFGEVEGGEFVVNKFATQSFLPMLEAINQNGQSGMDREAPVTSSSQMMPIVKTYVLASDVSSQQEAQKRISDLARL
jgi:hypothetical protein